MSKVLKTLLIVSAALVVVGGILATAAFFSGAATNLVWDGNRLALERAGAAKNGNLVHFEEKDLGEVTEIEMDVDMMDVTVKKGDAFAIEGSHYPDRNELKYDKQGSKLVLRSKSKRRVSLGFNLGTELKSGSLTVYIPENAPLDRVDIRNSLGNLNIEALQAQYLHCDLDLGDIQVDSAAVQTLSMDLDAGSCTLENVTAEKTKEINLNLGDLKLYNTVLNNAEIDLDMGNVSGQKVSMNHAEISCNAGDVDLDGILTGKIEMECDLGSVSLDIDGAAADYYCGGSTDLGSIRINGGNAASSGATNPSAPNRISYEVECGDVEINFSR